MITKRFLVYTAWIFVFASISVNCSLMNNLMINLIAYTSDLPSVNQANLDAYQPGQPVETNLDAVICARSILQANRIHWVETPETIFVDRVPYQEAVQIIQQGKTAVKNDVLAEDAQVWLVMLKGTMTITPPMCQASSPNMGCVFAILDANDGTEIESGSISCEALDLNP